MLPAPTQTSFQGSSVRILVSNKYCRKNCVFSGFFFRFAVEYMPSKVRRHLYWSWRLWTPLVVHPQVKMFFDLELRPPLPLPQSIFVDYFFKGMWWTAWAWSSCTTCTAPQWIESRWSQSSLNLLNDLCNLWIYLEFTWQVYMWSQVC